MTQFIPVLKDEIAQQAIPTAWRAVLTEIVEGLRRENLDAVRKVTGVRPISESTADRIFKNIKTYGAHLSSLSEDTWNTSVCQWMIGHWDVLVDLCTVEEGASDLTLDVRVYEESANYAFEINSVHVP